MVARGRGKWMEKMSEGSQKVKMPIMYVLDVFMLLYIIHDNYNWQYCDIYWMFANTVVNLKFSSKEENIYNYVRW